MGRCVAVTGGAHGIGAAAVERLVAAGCEVHVLDVTPPDRTEVRHVPCDLADTASIDAAVAQLPASLDALINVAGVATTVPPVRAVAINFLGMRQLVERALPRMARGASIVIVASSAGHDWRKREADVRALLATRDYAHGLEWLRANAALWDGNPYKFSKQCAAAYTYAAAGLALAGGVRVNCINPGSTETRLTPAFRDLVGSALYEWGVAQIGRAGTPADIAEVIEFVAIGQCRWLNGVEILVDGGYIAGLVGGWIDPEAAPSAS